MSKIKFFPVNLWRNYDIASYTSQTPNFPATNTQLFDFKKAWHSRHGEGTGWGYFYIWSSGADQNNKIDFDEGGSELTATLTGGAYTADTLCAEIKTQMEAVGALTYTPEYLEAGSDKLKFKISGSGAFTLRTNTGTNQSDSVWGTIGFSTATDKTGATAYTADNVRIHTIEYIRIDLGAVKDINGVMIRGHNFQSTATVKAQFSSDNWSSVAEEPSFVIQDDILILQWDTAKQYRYIGIWIKDVDNSAGYVNMGTVWFATQVQPEWNFLNEMDLDTIDPSYILSSEAGQESTLQEDHYDSWGYVFRVVGSTELNKFLSMFAEVGTSKPLMICEDPNNYLTSTKYIKFTAIKRKLVLYSIQHWIISVGIKAER